jgi:signal transduction histidine kinase
MSLIKNLSIKNKLIAIVLLATVPSIVLGFSVIIINDVLQLKKNLVNDTQLYADLVGEVSLAPLSFGDRSGARIIMEKLRAIPEIENGYIYDENSEVFGFYSKGDNSPFPHPPEPKKAFYKFERDQLHVALPISFQNKKYGTIYVIISTKSLSQSTRNRVISLLLVMVGLILLSYFLALRFQDLISKPILKLARITEEISQKPDYSVRVHKEGRDEIGTLYDGFNNMLEQIQLWEKKRDKAEAEQLRLLEELEEKNNELEQVIFVTSHDLRSPLVNLQGFSQELVYSLKELRTLMNKIETIPEDLKTKFSNLIEDDIFDSLKYIQSSTSKMDGLLSGLLKLSRVSRMDSTFESIDMNRLILEITNSFEFQIKESGVKLRVGELPPCFGNELQINQVFSNLLNNALKYLAPQRPGEIEITGKEMEITERKQQYTVYCVKDNGIGIPPASHKKIFELFSRLNPDDSEGEGLGLTIVYKIISRHHGKIWVESEPDQGSQFFVMLPTVPVFSDASLLDSTPGPITTSSK